MRLHQSRTRAMMVLALSLPLAGCAAASQSQEAATTTPGAAATTAADLHSLLPQDIQNSGVVRVASSMDLPPMEYLDESGAPAGVDIDLGHALGDALGVNFQFINTSYDGIIPALNSGKFDASMSYMYVTPKRSEQIDFVPYAHSGGTAGIVRIEDVGKFPNLDLNALCGARVGTQSGTAQAAVIDEQNLACKSAGKPEIVISTFPSESNQFLALESGRVDMATDDGVIAAFKITKQPGKYASIQLVSGADDLGIGVAKGNAALRDAIEKALQRIVEDGTYASILEKAKVSQIALTKWPWE